MIKLLQGNCLDVLPTLEDESIDCCITSPPYWGLRDYGVEGQLGMETTYQEYVDNLLTIFSEVRRVLKPKGTLWLNLGDSYSGSAKGLLADGTQTAGKKQATDKGSCTGNFKKAVTDLKPKDLIGIPWRVAFALQNAGWYLRQDIIWYKPNVMPESVTDRCTKSHEYIFLLSKSSKYYFDHEAIQEPCLTQKRGREKNNGESAVDTKKRGFGSHCGTKELRSRRSVWTVQTRPYVEAHFATFPVDLIEPCVLAGCPKGGVVLDPFLGSGTTALAARLNERSCVGIELNPKYLKIALKRVERGGRNSVNKKLIAAANMMNPIFNREAK